MSTKPPRNSMIAGTSTAVIPSTSANTDALGQGTGAAMSPESGQEQPALDSDGMVEVPTDGLATQVPAARAAIPGGTVPRVETEVVTVEETPDVVATRHRR